MMKTEKSVYDFAVERKDSEPLDNLTICSLASQREGLSYGKYMAKYNYHPPCLAGVEDEEPPLQKEK